MRLQAELHQERELKEMLAGSVSDLRSTLCELQQKLHTVDGEGNEWKTRYETQMELNGQLERQMSLIHQRLEVLRGNPVDRLASIRSFDDLSVEALRQRLKLLTEERSDLQNQLMDCQLRIEQEGKAFHKTNDERRAYLSEIAKMSSTLEGQRRQHTSRPSKAAESRTRRDVAAAAVERRGEKKSKEGSRLPKLGH
uniref:Coiled-coil domain containing 169 n=2 Tax=Tetraodon nigroviridis TaxID=99883 RepID=H3CX30_TETNG